jgi:cadmium resistance protein CadD (predicted permease)
MTGLWKDGLTAIAAFIATNLDDILILILLFSQVNATFRRRHIFMGQYVGFTVLVLLCLPGYFGGQLIPETWIGLLGLLPIAIGIKQLVTSASDAPENSPAADITSARLSKRNDNALFHQFPAPLRGILRWLTILLAPQTCRVAAVTVANGGDNVGIYLPLFASSNAQTLMTTLVVFGVAIALLCCLALQFTRQPTVAKIFMKYGDRLVPYCLIALGLSILWRSLPVWKG